MSLFTPQTPARRCPRCSAQWLWGYRYRQQELDVCRACGGLWFDRGEVNGLLRQLHPEQAPECFTETFGASLGPADIHCPDCAIPLERHHLLLNYHSEIDICGRCEGSWIDKDELPQLEQSPALQQHLDDINQGISWKTFLFQIFSQLPVEYNIKPKRTPWVNYVLLLANLIIFMAYYFYPPNYDYVLSNFAMTPIALSAGEQWWTVITAVFLHGSVIHLLGNLYFLYIIGDNLEDVLGHWRYLLLYLGCGVFASLSSMVVRLGSDVPSLGASGAIAGLFGMYLLWFRHASLTFMFIIYQKKLSALWFFILWLAINIFGLLFQNEAVDYAAHLGGFFIGIVIGLALKQKVLAANPILGLLSRAEVKLKR